MFFLVLTVGCGHAGAYNPEINNQLQTSVSSTTLGPGDVFEVRVYRETELSGIFQVSPEGTIDFPLLGTIKVDSRNSSQIASMIRDGLSKGYIKEPFVTVTVKEFNSKRIYVLGQVDKPGTFKYEEGMSVIQAITLAGGFSKLARPNAVLVTRTEDGREVKTVVPVTDISEGKAKNFLLHPGDIVFVPESIL